MVTMRFKLLFFDAGPVVRMMDRVTRQALSHAGALVRQTARFSIKRRRGPSPPGQPPHSHVGTLRRLIFYSWDPNTRSVVIGPTPFGRAEAPPLLEHGGTALRARPRRAGGRPGPAVRAVYRARPFMGPARAEVEPRLPGFFVQAELGTKG